MSGGCGTEASQASSQDNDIRGGIGREWSRISVMEMCAENRK